MSIIEGVDPHPGRCVNMRPSRDAHGYPTTKRCLDYEGHEGACRFPDDPKRVATSGGTQMNVYSQRKPEPWVSPLG